MQKIFMSRIVRSFQKAMGRKSKQIHQTVTASVHAGSEVGHFGEQPEWGMSEGRGLGHTQDPQKV